MGAKQDIQVEQLQERRARISLSMEIRHFHLPPVESVLVIGKRAGIGPKAMEKALEEMVPASFELVTVEHDTIEALLIRSAHLRRVPREKLVPIIVRNCENLMDDSEMLHFDLDIRVVTTDEIEV